MERKGGMRQQIAERSLRTFDGLVERFYSLEVKGQENLDSIREMQMGFRRSEYGKPIPMVVIFNHIAGDDIFSVFETLDRSLGGAMGIPILPVSDVYMQLIKHPAYAIGARVAQLIFNFDVFPVRQAYRTRTAEGMLLRDDSDSQTLAFMNKLTEKFIEGGCLIIAPTGHRSPNNSLQPAESSIGVAVRKLMSLIIKEQIPEAIILPIGIEYPGLPAKKFHLGLKKVSTKLSVGQPLLATEILGDVNLFSQEMNLKGIKERVLITDYLMMRLADLLSEEMRGVYNPKSKWFKDALEGRAKLVQRGKEVKIELVR